jgi:hypothetical protein
VFSARKGAVFVAIEHQVLELRALGLNNTQILAALLLGEQVQLDRLGELLAVGPRALQGVLKALRGVAGRPVKALSAKKNASHDHDLDPNHDPNHDHEVSPAHASAPEAQENSDPLFARLVKLGIFASVAEGFLARFDRERIERHVAAHEARLERGWKPDRCPAPAYLHRCIIQDKWPPVPTAPGLLEARRQRAEEAAASKTMRAALAKAAEGSAEHQAIAGTVVAVAAPPVAPEPVTQPEAPTVPLTRAGAMTAYRIGCRSKMPGLRADAHRLALEWGFDLAPFADAAPGGT